MDSTKKDEPPRRPRLCLFGQGRPSPDPALERVQRFHARQCALCEGLELISDELPAFDAERNVTFLANLMPELRMHHALEEGWLFPLLARRLSDDDRERVNLERLRQEHMEDRDAAADLRDAVLNRPARAGRPDVERVAYQSRALFRSLRRHVAFEAEVIFSLAEVLMTTEDLACLSKAYDATDLVRVDDRLRH